jgi:hypothetical protein
MIDHDERGSFRSPGNPAAISIIGILRNYLDRDVRQTLRLIWQDYLAERGGFDIGRYTQLLAYQQLGDI